MNTLLKNSHHTVRIEGYSADGSGVARIGGQVVFVKGALNGELCEIKILKSLKNLAYAKLERVIEHSENRTAPVCPNFGKCGGCDFLHMDYIEELHFKKQRVEDAFARIGGLTLPLSAIHGADATVGYRNKAIYAIGMSDGRAIAGFFRERSHDIIPVKRCYIQTEASDLAAEAVCRWIDDCGISVYDERTGLGLVRHVFVRTAFGTGQMAVCIVAAGEKLSAAGALIETIRAACPRVTSVVLCVNKKPGNTVLGDRFKTLWGSDCIEEVLCSLRFKLSPRSFFQINTCQAELLYSKVVEFTDVDASCTVLDLYCGIGSISLVLARKAGHVIGVEIVPEAVSDAVENAKKNDIKNAEFICGDAAKAAAELKTRGVTPSIIVVDPPRKGLDLALIDTIVGMAPDRVVYVSCDPATLARDIRLLTQRGYRFETAEALDLFPRCAHVETVVLLSRETNPLTVEVRMEVETGEVKEHPTYKRIQEYVQEKYGFKVHTAYIAEVKRMVGLDMHKAPNAVEQRKHEYHPCPPEKVEAIKDALRHFGLIAE